MTLAALIFDVDGTLAETEELHRRAFNASFAAAGLPWQWDVARYADLLTVTGGKERIRHFIDRYAAQPALDPAAIARLHADKTRRYAEQVAAGGIGLRPGVARLLAQARAAGLSLAIATTTSPANVDSLLAATLGMHATAWFESIAAGDCVAAKKPAADVYRLVLERLQLPACACLALEDTPNGLRAAMDAGIATVVCLSKYGGTAGFDAAAAVVDHLGDPDLACHVVRGPPVRDGLVDLPWLQALLTERRHCTFSTPRH